MPRTQQRTRTRIPSLRPYQQRSLHRWTTDGSADTPSSPRPVPAPAAGIELLGQFQDSGMTSAPWLVRRPDGAVVQLSALLYLVLSALDGRRDVETVATQVSGRFGRRVSPANVEYLLNEKLQPLNLLQGDGAPKSPAPKGRRSLFFRCRTFPGGVVQAMTWPLLPLFNPVVVGLVLGLLISFDTWLVRTGVGSALQGVLADPVRMLMVLGMVMACMMFHELGHAAACRYGGARPAGIGIGLYLVWLTLYTDVTDTYRLDRRGRLRTDLGGVYFNAVATLVLGAIYALTGDGIYLVTAIFQQYTALMQLFPFMRTDGYHILSDVTGVPDISRRIWPVLRSLVPWTKPDARVTELKRWVRATVTVWVTLSILLMAALTAFSFKSGARLVEATRDSVQLQWKVLFVAWHAGLTAHVALSAVSIVILVLPFVGSGLALLMILKPVGRGAWNLLGGGRRTRRMVAATVVGSDGSAVESAKREAAAILDQAQREVATR